MDITFLLLRWLVIFTTYFLIGLSIGSIAAYFWISWKEKKAHKQFMEELYKYRK
jgi:hypothetical protein